MKLRAKWKLGEMLDKDPDIQPGKKGIKISFEADPKLETKGDITIGKKFPRISKRRGFPLPK